MVVVVGGVGTSFLTAANTFGNMLLMHAFDRRNVGKLFVTNGRMYDLIILQGFSAEIIYFLSKIINFFIVHEGSKKLHVLNLCISSSLNVSLSTKRKLPINRLFQY